MTHGDGPGRRHPRTPRREAGEPAAPRRRHWADYLYVLPALGVMLLVIGYPIYYTVYLSFFTTPPSLAMCEQDLRRPRQLRRRPEQRRLPRGHDEHGHLDGLLHLLLLRARLRRGAGAATASSSGRGVLRGILLIPYVVSAVAAAYVWRWLYHSDFGVIGALSVQLGHHRPADHLPRQCPHRCCRR